MKPFLWLFLVFMLLFSLLGGCKMQTIQPPADSSFADKEKELEIYCLESANLSGSLSAFREAYPDVRLSIEKFKTSRQMKDDLIGRIHTKDAADVVLFDYSTTLDFEKLAGAMAFYPLTQLIAADETFFADNYLPAVTKDHSIDGEQYFYRLASCLLPPSAPNPCWKSWDWNRASLLLQTILQLLKATRYNMRMILFP